MTLHLVTDGYALTECGLTSALPGSLVVRLEDVTCKNCRTGLIRKGVCPECGEKQLTWGIHPRNKSGVADGRLRVSDVETTFYLACNHCSETLLAHVDPETVAAALTARGWTPG